MLTFFYFKNMRIRKATPQEASILAKLMNLAMREITYQFIGETNSDKANAFLAYFIALPDNQYSYENIYVAEVGNEIAGQICLYDGAKLLTLRKPIWEKIKSDFGKDYHAAEETQAGEFYIDTLAVAPQYQGKGIGKALLEFAIEEFVKKRQQTLGLLVEKDNDKAKRLYEKLGFEVVEQIDIFGKVMEHMQIKA